MARTAPVPNIPPIPGMCPSIAVLGGGGSGGGGSGNGAGDGSGDGSGTGDGSGDGANGDGTGAGSCGNGANASCANCSAGTSAGDPVDVLTGEVFTLPKTDLFLSGFFNLQIDRRYSSFRRRVDCGLGWGWTHSLAWEIQLTRTGTRISSGRGNEIELGKLERAGEETGWQGWGLMRLADGFVLRPGNEFLHFFSPDPKDATRFRLEAIQYRQRGAVRLEYDRGRLARIIDTAGRVVVVASDAAGRITSMSVPSPSGPTIVFARYAYDAAGNLIESIDADGASHTYTYDDDHRLVAMRVPSGMTFHFVYDTEGRCTETWGAGDGPEPSLAADAPSVLADGTTRARGVLHAKIEFGPDGTSEVIDSRRIRRFSGSPGGVVTKGLTGRGGVVSRALDAAGNITRQVDPAGGVWHYAYDKLGNVIGQIDPENHEIRHERDREGRVTRTTDAAGGVMEYGRDANGDVEWMRDPRGGLRRFGYDARGLVSSESRPDGSTWRYEHDAHANLVALVRPNGATSRYRYDHWGRRTAEEHPNGERLSFGYSNAGNLTSVTDALGRTKQMAYDGFGNLVTEIEPDGAVYRYHFGGIGWLYAVEYPDGARVTAEYDREGWITRFSNEKGERHELERDANGDVTFERGFDGSFRRFTRDARGHVIAIQDALGKTEIERNKRGQIVLMTGPSGGERKLAYDARGELVSATSDGVTFLLDREPLGEVVRESLQFGDAAFTLDSERDTMGRRRSLRTSLGHEVETTLDRLGDVSELTAGGAPLVRFDRNAMGWPVKRELPAGGAIVDELDAAARLTRRTVLRSGAPIRDGKPDWIGGPPPGTCDKSYQYFPNDEVASITTAADGTTEHAYDLRRRVLERTGRKVEERFRYDATSNVAESGVVAPTRVYGPGDRLEARGDVEIAYDKRGRIVEKRSTEPSGAVAVTRFSYDDWDMLRAIDAPDGRRWELRYDAFARRVEKRELVREPTGALRPIATTRYVWDLVHLVHEVERRGSAEPVVRTYLFEDDRAAEPLAQRTGDAGAWTYHVGDHLGAPEELVDGSGRVVGRSSHSAFGRWTWSQSDPETTPFRFPGQYEDAETGLHYNRYRYYDPDLGRYLSPDPIGLAGGFNAYRYGPNPVGWFDPMGWAGHSLQASWNRGTIPNPWESTMGTQPHGLECPDCLASQSRCHTERQLLHHLENNPSTRGRLNGSRLDMTGELPPCPQCHRAMHDFAQRHNATITYTYPGGGTVTYAPGQQPSAPPGTGAHALLHGGVLPDGTQRRGEYGDMLPTSAARPRGSGGREGQHGTESAVDRYDFGGTTPSRAYADERDRVRPPAD